MARKPLLYKDLALGSTVKEVMERFKAHPGIMDLHPFAFEVYDSMTVFYDSHGNLCEKGEGTYRALSEREVENFEKSVSEGAVEIYVARRTAGVRKDLVSEKIVLHAATGKAIPME